MKKLTRVGDLCKYRLGYDNGRGVDVWCKLISIKDEHGNLYNEYNVSRVFVENNNWWWIIERILSKNWLACETVKTTKDKMTRFLEKKGKIQNWQVLFHKHQSTPLIQQLEVFTWQDWWDDDIVDAMLLTINQEKWQFL